MGIRNTNVKAGDLFEWHYVHDDDDVVVLGTEEIGTYEDEDIDDTFQFQWFPIGNTCLMIAITTDRYFWISKNKFCHCYYNDDYLKFNNTPFLVIQTLD